MRAKHFRKELKETGNCYSLGRKTKLLPSWAYLLFFCFIWIFPRECMNYSKKIFINGEEWVEGWMGGWIHGWIMGGLVGRWVGSEWVGGSMEDGWVNGWMNGWMDRWMMGGWVGGWVEDEWMGGQKNESMHSSHSTHLLHNTSPWAPRPNYTRIGCSQANLWFEGGWCCVQF